MNADQDLLSILEYFATASHESIILINVLCIFLWMMTTLIHELGHYFVAKWLGVISEQIEVGSGPALLKFGGKGECKFMLKIIPFGGRIVYTDDILGASHLNKALIHAGGWFADVLIAIGVVVVINLSMVSGPLSFLVSSYLICRAAVNWSPLTSDGRKIIKYLWWSAIGVINSH